jgi:AAA domain
LRRVIAKSAKPHDQHRLGGRLWDAADQIEPIALLERAAEGKSFAYPCWENGLVDLWDDEPVAHAVASVKHGLKEHLKRRIWSGQASVLLPFTFRILRSTIARYLDVLERKVFPSVPLIKNFNGRETRIVDPWKLGFHDVRELTKDVISRGELDMLKIAGGVRNAMAHHDIVDAQRINLFSDHYEANRHFLDSDIPGWDWPRCGQSMIMTVGPSGAGKSTWSAAQGTEVVSSDAIRSELTAAPDLPGDQSEIFRRVRYRSSSVLSNGRDVIVDAMHVEVKNRIRQVAIAPPDLAVRYAVIDRPLAEKQRDAGWRAGRGIVERYHEEFAQQVEVVLAGDGDPRVKVQDLRNVSTK